jgi:hypothetical protein
MTQIPLGLLEVQIIEVYGRRQWNILGIPRHRRGRTAKFLGMIFFIGFLAGKKVLSKSLSVESRLSSTLQN